MHEGKMCGCPHHWAVPLLITLIGLDFFFNAMGWWVTDSILAVSWPALLALVGVTKMTSGMCKCCA